MNPFSNKPSLTVCIACKGIPDLLKANLTALNCQTLDKKHWEIVILINTKEHLQLVEKFLKSLRLKANFFVRFQKNNLQELRNLALVRVQTPLLFFIDEDVILKNPNHLKVLIRLHKRHPEETLLGGGYLSSKECSFFGQAYNWISRLWMKENPGLIPAGNLSLKTSLLNPECRFKSPLPTGFGGEEIHFFNQVIASGGKALWIKELNVPHEARHNLRDFIERAIIHGKSRRAFFSSKKTFLKSFKRFLTQPGSLKVKIPAFFYLSLVQLTSLFVYLISKKS